MLLKCLVAVVVFLSSIALPACGPSATDNAMATVREIDDLEKLAKGWAYNDQVDEMRAEATRVASVRAEGWGTMAPELYVLKNPKRAPQIAIRGSLDEAASPQMQCAGSLNIKFDDGPIRKVDCQMGMVVVIDPTIIPDLRKSKRTWIEIETSIGSVMQYKFNTADLII